MSLTLCRVKRLALFSVVLAVTVCASLFNMQNASASMTDLVVGIENAAATLIYIGAWTAYALLNRDRGLCIAVSVWSGVTLFTALYAILNIILGGALEPSGIPSAFLSFLSVAAVMPFYGIYMITANGIAGCTVIAVIAAAWLILGIVNARK